jgi:hypothetical protein
VMGLVNEKRLAGEIVPPRQSGNSIA